MDVLSGADRLDVEGVEGIERGRENIRRVSRQTVGFYFSILLLPGRNSF